MTIHRKAELRRAMLRYLGDMLHAHPEVDTGMYDGLSDEEADVVAEMCREEGQRMRERGLR